MQNIVGLLLQLEIDPGCSVHFQRSQIATEALVHSLRHTFTLHGHDGCVNTINWNDSGSLLASGSDDQQILLWRQNGHLLRRLPTIHSNNIFSVVFVPHARDHLVLSAAGDNQILLHELEELHPNSNAQQPSHIQQWECGGRVKKLVTIRSEPRLFWSVSEDGFLKQYDLREDKTLEYAFKDENYGPLKSLAINEQRPEMLAFGISNAMVPIYDRRNMQEPMMRLLPAHLSMCGEGRFLATSLAFNQRGDELLVNIGSDNIYIFDVRHPNKHTSPDVLSTLQSYISDDPTYAFFTSEEAAGMTTAFLEEQHQAQLNKINRLENETEYTRAIDKCSKLLAKHFSNYNGSPNHPFAMQIHELDNAVANRIRSHLLRDANFLTQFFLARGRCYMERSWESDQLDAIRDFLSTLRIQPRHRTAHMSLVKSLYLLGQYQLARDCFAFYQKLFPDDVTAEQTIKKLEEEKPKDENPVWKRSTDGKDTRDYVNKFTGHLNINTDIKEANWFGGDGQYIVAGSDCGSIFIWERRTQRVIRVFKGDNYTVNCIQPHPRRCLLASSGIDNVIRFWEPSATALKAATELNQPEETEERDLTASKYELMKKNRRKRTPELVWEQLLNSVGLGIFRVDSAHGEDGDEEREEPDENNHQEGDPHVIRCRQM